MKNKVKNILEAILAIFTAAAIIFLMYFWGDRLMPTRESHGGLWDSYLSEEENVYDVMFFGSSMVYCDINPLLVYEETGLSCYSLAGPGQMIPVTYYSILEALKTQSPKAIFLELSMMFEEQSDYSRVNVGYMPWGANRVKAALTCEEDALNTLLFPLYGYHGELSEALKQGSLFNRSIPRDEDKLCGYTFLTDIYPVEEDTLREGWLGAPETDYYARNEEYLRKIGIACEEKGIELVLFLSPTANTVPEECLEALSKTLESVKYHSFTDYSAMTDELGIFRDSDFYDPRHLNYTGAEKFSAAISEKVSELGLMGGENEDLEARLQYYYEQKNSVQ